MKADVVTGWFVQQPVIRGRMGVVVKQWWTTATGGYLGPIVVPSRFTLSVLEGE